MTVPDDVTQAILERNARVELEKAWEVSITRRLTILILTYLIVSLFMWQIGIDDYYLQAIVPTGGYLLSTLSVPWIKTIWMRRNAKKTE